MASRQVLFSKEDIGKKKVEAAAKALQFHNLSTGKSACHHQFNG